METQKQHTLIKVFIIASLMILLVGLVSAERSTPNPSGRSHLWSEDTTTALIVDDSLREDNNAFIESLINKNDIGEEPMAKVEVIKEATDTTMQIPSSINKNLTGEQLRGKNEEAGEYLDLILFFGFGILLFILFVFVIGWLKNKGSVGQI